ARWPGRHNTIAPANYLQWQDRNQVFEQMSSLWDGRVNLTGQESPEELTVQNVTPNFFTTLGVEPLLGRTFSPDEGPDGRNRVAILSHALWQRRFGSDPSIVGKTIQLNSLPFTVIGVMPADVSVLIKVGSLVGKTAELWRPFAYTEADRQPRGRYALAIARLKPDVPLDRARAQMKAVASSLT